MQNSLDEDHIPLLNDLIVPGKTSERTKDRAEQTDANDNSEALLAHAANQKSPTSGASKTAFEAAIEAMVTEILNRHLETARKEIIRAVLAEVRARMAGRSKTKQPEGLAKK